MSVMSDNTTALLREIIQRTYITNMKTNQSFIQDEYVQMLCCIMAHCKLIYFHVLSLAPKSAELISQLVNYIFFKSFFNVFAKTSVLLARLQGLNHHY